MLALKFRRAGVMTCRIPNRSMASGSVDWQRFGNRALIEEILDLLRLTNPDNVSLSLFRSREQRILGW